MLESCAKYDDDGDVGFFGANYYYYYYYRVFMSSIVFILFIYPRISGYVLRIVVELHFADLAV